MNKELLKEIDNSISSILWISTDDFKNSSQLFQEFNYLTDGILETKNEKLEGLYQTNSFNRPLQIALIKKDSSQSIVEASKPLLGLMLKSSSSKILIVHANLEEKIIEKFSKNFKNHTFLEFKIVPENLNE